MARQWFYEFRLPSGKVTPCYCPPAVRPIHATRVQMLNSVVDPLIASNWPDTTCLDIACHEGFFSQTLAAKGARSVLGVDGRSENVEHAEWIRDALGRTNLRFEQHNVYDINAEKIGNFDVVLMFGLLYHLENPLAALKILPALTRRVCVIETQVAPGVTQGPLDWGHAPFKKMIEGSFVIVREDDVATNHEAGLHSLSLVPSTDALVWILKYYGFKRVEVVPCPPKGYEQFACGSRVVIAAYPE